MAFGMKAPRAPHAPSWRRAASIAGIVRACRAQRLAIAGHDRPARQPRAQARKPRPLTDRRRRAAGRRDRPGAHARCSWSTCRTTSATPKAGSAQKGLGTQAARKPIPVLQSCCRPGAMPAARWCGSTGAFARTRPNLAPDGPVQGQAHGRLAWAMPSARRIDHGPSLVQGGWGAQVIDELAVAPGDITRPQASLSAASGTTSSTACCASRASPRCCSPASTPTAACSRRCRTATFLGYDCVLLQDACSTPSPAYVTQGRALHRRSCCTASSPAPRR